MALHSDGEYIRIQGDLVQFVEERVTRQALLKDVIDKLEISQPVTLPTIGRTQVFAHFEQVGMTKRLFAMTEIPPAVRFISKNIYSGTARRYKLSMPWTYIWFVAETADQNINAANWAFTSYRIFHSKTQYKGIDDEFIAARLPNVYADGRICWGATGVDPRMTLADRFDQLTNEWYVSRFNTDLDGPHSYPNGADSFREWVLGTLENNRWFETWNDWTDPLVTKYSVRRLLEEFGSTPFMERINNPGAIPEVPTNLTFGAWDQWWNQLEPLERARARISINNLAEDTPDDFPAEIPVLVGTDDDGGEDIPYEFGD